MFTLTLAEFAAGAPGDDYAKAREQFAVGVLRGDAAGYPITLTLSDTAAHSGVVEFCKWMVNLDFALPGAGALCKRLAITTMRSKVFVSESALSNQLHEFLKGTDPNLSAVNARFLQLLALAKPQLWGTAPGGRLIQKRYKAVLSRPYGEMFAVARIDADMQPTLARQMKTFMTSGEDWSGMPLAMARTSDIDLPRLRHFAVCFRALATLIYITYNTELVDCELDFMWVEITHALNNVLEPSGLHMQMVLSSLYEEGDFDFSGVNV